MHPRTPERLRRFAETHRQVGAICKASNWLEYQLEIAFSELSGTDDLTETQGQRWLSLVKALKALLNEGVVTDAAAEAGLRDLLSRISAEMGARDQIVHSTWLYTNSTKPGHISGQRYRPGREERRDSSPDQLERVFETLEALEEELGRAAWNAVKPPHEQI